MAQRFVHTIFAEGRWQNTFEGETSQVYELYDTKADAVAAGRAEAQRRKTEHLIHRKDGSVEERNSYGNDPRHRRG
jgi:hypothetical protein